MNFTNEQQKAIYTYGSNIIVSAGAGSGKTAVLTERIYQKLLSGIDVSNLLVLTFTKAAALEMKTRIKKRVKKGIENIAKGEEKVLVSGVDLKKQYNKIDSAFITTFDSFALSIVKKYHYLLDVDKNVKIVDDIVMVLKKKEIIDMIFNKLYIQENVMFQNLLEKFSHKEDSSLKDSILSIAEKVQKQPNKADILNNYKELYFNEEKINGYINAYEKECNLRLRDLLDDAKEIYDFAVGSKLGDELNNFIDFISLDHDYETILAYFSTFKMSNAPKGMGLSDVKEKFSKKINNYKKEFLTFTNKEEFKTTIYSTLEFTDIIVCILKDFFEELLAFKKSKGMYEFDDISAMVLELFHKHPDVLEEVKNSFAEILLDEYQDTSDVQEAFMKLIGNNNIYMVGDMKQSIYRFRNANPYIFKEKYDNYENYDGEYKVNLNKLQSNGIKIDLNKNFRSRKEVLDNINLMFNHLMKDSCGDAEYEKEHQMNFGNGDYLKYFEKDISYNQEYLTYTPDSEKIYSNKEIEIFIIIDKIKKLIESNYQVYDKDLRCLRKIEYKDIAVIVPRKNYVELMQKIFTSNGIPYCLSVDEKISDSLIIRVLSSLFNLVYNVDGNNLEAYKYYFVSIARSFLFRQSDNLILNESFNDFVDNEIYEKAKKVKYFSYNNSMIKTFEYMLEEFKIYENLIKLGDIEQHLIVINYISDMISNLTELGYNLEDVAKHFEQIMDQNVEIKYENKTKNNGVIIINIHKSKGLEYPVCFFADLDSSFNRSDVSEMFIYDKNFGFISPYFSNGPQDSILKLLYKNNYIKEDVSERVRLFYVALTRAREKMYFILPEYDSLKHVKNEFEFKSLSCFITHYFENTVAKYCSKVNYEDLVNKDYLEYTESNYMDSIEIKNPISYIERNYKPSLVEKVRISKDMNELLTGDVANLLETGNRLHEILQTINLRDKDYSKLNLNSNEEKILQRVLALDCFSNLDAAKLYKEMEFEYSLGGKTYHGIIDLLVEYDSHFEIIDYKLSDIDKPEYVRQLNEYYKYLRQISDKPIKMYLLSITKAQLKEIFVVE